MATASCNADTSSSTYGPYVTLTVTTSGGSAGNNICTASYILSYHTRGSASYTNGQGRAYTITIDGQKITGTYNINGVSSGTIRTGSVTVNRGTGGLSRNISISIAFNFDINWSGTYYGNRTGSTTVATTSIRQTYTVSYNANGGSGAPASQTKQYGITLKLSSTIPKRDGYRFVGWGTSSGAASASYQPGGNYTSNAAITLYAIWTINSYIISYNANGGTGAPGSQTKIYGVTLVLSTTVPTKSGYKFLGWATTSTATTAQYQPGANFTSNATTTLYAVWKLNIFYIYFNANGGTGAPTMVEKTNEVDLTLPTDEPTRKRHNFLGWATDKDATSATYQPGGVFSLNQDTVLYAVWQLTDDYILIKSTGTCEAVEFIEDTSGLMFQDGGKVHATEFIETNDGILIGNVMYFGELEEV